MAFIADDLAAWLISLFADGAKKKLTKLVLGDEVERALRAAATTAIQATAAELFPQDSEHAAAVINEVFRRHVLAPVVVQCHTMLQTLHDGVGNQLAVLDDTTITGAGVSSADVLGVPAPEIADRLAANLIAEIRSRAGHGGPLVPLADQLNHDRTFLQGDATQVAVRQMRAEILAAITQIPIAQVAAPPPATVEPDIGLHVDQAFEGLELDQHGEAERRLYRLFMHLTRQQQRASIATIVDQATGTDNQTTQLLASNLLQAADRLDPTLIDTEHVELLASSDSFSLRGCAANLLWSWSQSNPGRVPVPLLGRLSQPSTEDWYVQSPARAGARMLLLSREAARQIFDRMAASQDRHDRDYAVGDLIEVAEVEPRAVPKDLARKLAGDEDQGVAARGAQLLQMLQALTDQDRIRYYHPFGI
jgi:hypothetical protein